jgi:hypothetical protein
MITLAIKREHPCKRRFVAQNAAAARKKTHPVRHAKGPKQTCPGPLAMAEPGFFFGSVLSSCMIGNCALSQPSGACAAAEASCASCSGDA